MSSSISSIRHTSSSLTSSNFFHLNPVNICYHAIYWNQPCSTVYLCGSFNDWKLRRPMELTHDGSGYYQLVELKYGKHLFKFVADRKWTYDESKPITLDKSGNTNNFLVVPEIALNDSPSSFQLNNSSVDDFTKLVYMVGHIPYDFCPPIKLLKHLMFKTLDEYFSNYDMYYLPHTASGPSNAKQTAFLNSTTEWSFSPSDFEKAGHMMFYIDFDRVTHVDNIEFGVGFIKPWLDWSQDELLYDYAISILYHGNHGWVKALDKYNIRSSIFNVQPTRKPNEKNTMTYYADSSSHANTQMVCFSLNCNIHALKLCLILHCDSRSPRNKPSSLPSILRLNSPPHGVSTLTSTSPTDLTKNQESSSIIEEQTSDNPWGRIFTYTGEPFDKEGLLYWLGTNEGRDEVWKNPARLGKVGLEFSHPFPSNSGDKVDVIARYNLKSTHWGGSKPQWVILDIGQYYMFAPTHYTLRHGHFSANSYICNWMFQGSNDKAHWTTLHSVSESVFICGFDIKTFKIKECNELYRYFRIIQLGDYSMGVKDQPGAPYLCIGGFEMYGELGLATLYSLPNIINHLNLGFKSIYNRIGYKTFSHADNFDTNGILYYIGTNEGTERLVNPSESGKVDILISHKSMFLNYMSKHNIISHRSLALTYWGGTSPQWFIVDLKCYLVKVTSYSIRHGFSAANSYLYNWEFSGSKNGRNWAILHTGLESNFVKAFDTRTWQIPKCQEYYRYFRVLQKGNYSMNGKDEAESPYICISGFELYGDLISISKANDNLSMIIEARKMKQFISTSPDLRKHLVHTIQTSHDTEIRKKSLRYLLDILTKNSINLTEMLGYLNLKKVLSFNLLCEDLEVSMMSTYFTSMMLNMVEQPQNDAHAKEVLNILLHKLRANMFSYPSIEYLNHLIILLLRVSKVDPNVTYMKLVNILSELGDLIYQHRSRYYNILRKHYSLCGNVLEPGLFALPPDDPILKNLAKRTNAVIAPVSQILAHIKKKYKYDEKLHLDASVSSTKRVSEMIQFMQNQISRYSAEFKIQSLALKSLIEYIDMSNSPEQEKINAVYNHYGLCRYLQIFLWYLNNRLTKYSPDNLISETRMNDCKLDRLHHTAERILYCLNLQFQNMHLKDNEHGRNLHSIAQRPSMELLYRIFGNICIYGNSETQNQGVTFLKHVLGNQVEYPSAMLTRFFSSKWDNTDPMNMFNEQSIFNLLLNVMSINQLRFCYINSLFNIIQVTEKQSKQYHYRNSEIITLSPVPGQGRSHNTLSPHPFNSHSKLISKKDIENIHGPDLKLQTWTLFLLSKIMTSNNFPPHQGSKCQVCSMYPICGVRFRCMNCLNYDLCSNCEASFERQHDLGHVFCKISRPLPLIPESSRSPNGPLLKNLLYDNLSNLSSNPILLSLSPKIHINVLCNLCKRKITGIRYRCCHCLNFDLCGSCESINHQHNPIHIFAKIIEVLPEKINHIVLVPVVLHPGFYPFNTAKNANLNVQDSLYNYNPARNCDQSVQNQDANTTIISTNDPIEKPLSVLRTIQSSTQIKKPDFIAIHKSRFKHRKTDIIVFQQLKAERKEISSTLERLCDQQRRNLLSIFQIMYLSVKSKVVNYERFFLCFSVLMELIKQNSPAYVFEEIISRKHFMNFIICIGNHHCSYLQGVCLKLVEELFKTENYSGIDRNQVRSTMRTMREYLRTEVITQLKKQSALFLPNNGHHRIQEFTKFNPDHVLMNTIGSIQPNYMNIFNFLNELLLIITNKDDCKHLKLFKHQISLEADDKVPQPKHSSGSTKPSKVDLLSNSKRVSTLSYQEIITANRSERIEPWSLLDSSRDTPDNRLQKFTPSPDPSMLSIWPYPLDKIMDYVLEMLLLNNNVNSISVSRNCCVLLKLLGLINPMLLVKKNQLYEWILSIIITDSEFELAISNLFHSRMRQFMTETIASMHIYREFVTRMMDISLKALKIVEKINAHNLLTIVIDVLKQVDFVNLNLPITKTIDYLSELFMLIPPMLEKYASQSFYRQTAILELYLSLCGHILNQTFSKCTDMDLPPTLVTDHQVTTTIALDADATVDDGELMTKKLSDIDLILNSYATSNPNEESIKIDECRQVGLIPNSKEFITQSLITLALRSPNTQDISKNILDEHTTLQVGSTSHIELDHNNDQQFSFSSDGPSHLLADKHISSSLLSSIRLLAFNEDIVKMMIDILLDTLSFPRCNYSFVLNQILLPFLNSASIIKYFAIKLEGFYFLTEFIHQYPLISYHYNHIRHKTSRVDFPKRKMRNDPSESDQSIFSEILQKRDQRFSPFYKYILPMQITTSLMRDVCIRENMQDSPNMNQKDGFDIPETSSPSVLRDMAPLCDLLQPTGDRTLQNLFKNAINEPNTKGGKSVQPWIYDFYNPKTRTLTECVGIIVELPYHVILKEVRLEFIVNYGLKQTNPPSYINFENNVHGNNFLSFGSLNINNSNGFTASLFTSNQLYPLKNSTAYSECEATSWKQKLTLKIIQPALVKKLRITLARPKSSTILAWGGINLMGHTSLLSSIEKHASYYSIDNGSDITDVHHNHNRDEFHRFNNLDHHGTDEMGSDYDESMILFPLSYSIDLLNVITKVDDVVIYILNFPDINNIIINLLEKFNSYTCHKIQTFLLCLSRHRGNISFFILEQVLLRRSPLYVFLIEQLCSILDSHAQTRLNIFIQFICLEIRNYVSTLNNAPLSIIPFVKTLTKLIFYNHQFKTGINCFIQESQLITLYILALISEQDSHTYGAILSLLLAIVGQDNIIFKKIFTYQRRDITELVMEAFDENSFEHSSSHHGIIDRYKIISISRHHVLRILYILALSAGVQALSLIKWGAVEDIYQFLQAHRNTAYSFDISKDPDLAIFIEQNFHYIQLLSHQSSTQTAIGKRLYGQLFSSLPFYNHHPSFVQKVIEILRSSSNLNHLNKCLIAKLLKQYLKVITSHHQFSDMKHEPRNYAIIQQVLSIVQHVNVCIHHKPNDEVIKKVLDHWKFNQETKIPMKPTDVPLNINFSPDGNLETAKATDNSKTLRWKTVIFDYKLTHGVFKWEVTLVQCTDIAFGICLKNHNLNAHIGQFNDCLGYAYLISDSAKHAVYAEGMLKPNYGIPCTMGDVIGMIFDVNRGVLSFTHNKKSLGVAYSNIILKDFYPAISLIENNESVRISMNGTTSHIGLEVFNDEYFGYEVDALSPISLTRPNRLLSMHPAYTLRGLASAISKSMSSKISAKSSSINFGIKVLDHRDASPHIKSLDLDMSLSELIDAYPIENGILDLYASLAPSHLVDDPNPISKFQLSHSQSLLSHKSNISDSIFTEFVSQGGFPTIINLSEDLLNIASDSLSTPNSSPLKPKFGPPKSDIIDMKMKPSPLPIHYLGNINPNAEFHSHDNILVKAKKWFSWLELFKCSISVPGFQAKSAKNPNCLYLLHSFFKELLTYLGDRSQFEHRFVPTILEDGRYAFLENTFFVPNVDSFYLVSPESSNIDILTQVLKDQDKSELVAIDGTDSTIFENLNAKNSIMDKVELRRLIASSGSLALILYLLSETLSVKMLNPNHPEFVHCFKANELFTPKTPPKRTLLLSESKSMTHVNSKMETINNFSNKIQRGTGFRPISDSGDSSSSPKSYYKSIETSHRILTLVLHFIYHLLLVNAEGSGEIQYVVSRPDSGESSSTFPIDDIEKMNPMQPELDLKVYEILAASCLIPVLEIHLRNDSLMEIIQNIELYTCIFKLLNVIMCHERLIAVMVERSNVANSWRHSLSLLDRLSNSLITKIKSNLAIKRLSVDNLKFKHVSSGTSSSSGQHQYSNYSLVEEEKRFSLIVKTTEELVKRRFTYIESKDLHDRNEEVSPTDGEKDVGSPTIEMSIGGIDAYYVSYKQRLGPLQFQEIDMTDSNGFYIHHYRDQIEQECTSTPAKMKRLVQELGSLSHGLPLHLSSSIFMCTDSNRMDVIKFIITGPNDTPYQDGIFLFDCYCPADYPKVPPLINLQTTGNGSVRFNPNLYNSGKVCLSLLGTWRGGHKEMWDPSTSTLLQVLVSIQSLIFVDEPYFNEPGYEVNMGTEQGNRNSMVYNEIVRLATLRWAILDVLANPIPGFEEVIKSHFCLKKKSISSCCRKWLNEARERSSFEQYQKMTNVITKVQGEICSLDLQ